MSDVACNKGTAMKLIFDEKAEENKDVLALVSDCLKDVKTLEMTKDSPLIVCQDGKSKGYYIRCCMLAEDANSLLDTNAKLNPTDAESFRANRELLTEHNTYKRMVADAKAGREFNDIIVEYSKDYAPETPLKIWGGQHRAKAIQQAYNEAKVSRFHGFRIFFNLSKQQRTELALISNTNIDVSNDLFDRLLEETEVGVKLREWCYQVGLLKKQEDFPDQGSRAERITVKLARTFVTNFYLGKKEGGTLKGPTIDSNVYEPYLCESGVQLDPKYDALVAKSDDATWTDKALIQAGKAFAELHKSQQEAVKQSATVKRLKNLKGFRNKALTESVISSWAFVAGLLQGEQTRLANHYALPKTNKSIPDPLNARDMSTFQHDSDEATYRGLGTRSALKDRQRMAQVFLARSLKKDTLIDKSLMNKAVSQVVAIKSLQKGYTA
jgi:hypothetical protein